MLALIREGGVQSNWKEIVAHAGVQLENDDEEEENENGEYADDNDDDDDVSRIQSVREALLNRAETGNVAGRVVSYTKGKSSIHALHG
jgi:hypothetical protein